MTSPADDPTRAARLARFQPLSGMAMPRFAGLASLMRLPVLSPEAAIAEPVEIGLFGIPFDSATTNRPGARLGPRGVREQSALMRLVNPATGICPYELCACADLGDVAVNPVDVADTLGRIEAFAAPLRAAGLTLLAVGGDHLVSYPLLRTVAAGRPVGLIHIDAHSDTTDSYFGGAKLTHGTPFRRAIEDGVLDPRRTVQIGLRGTLYARDERQWALDQGIRILDMERVIAEGLPAAVTEARAVVGAGPTYLTFDIDSIDPAFAPGTGTPEIGGFTSREALFLLRGLRGLDLVGADLVEVAPPLDPSGTTALVGATIAFELLCLLAEARARRAG
ncbi:agmatinase [Methylobacterium sp. 4-46]|uniref:agmatinase n=1 Tax=unclassified Methylobacterium TaxID=2615210 RepID=UPI000152DA2F|nr:MULTISPECIES: agmatinase [Methylobacterium]ACA21197.1 agmatinase [Methylobacterium sp. 4-46]WFT80343.1 agmatinase [Methylobacterium nodulans]